MMIYYSILIALENELALLKQSREKILTERNEYYTKWQEYLVRLECDISPADIYCL